MDRIKSGERRLDEILGGGIPANSITVIAGAPGTGKTMLAQQYLFHLATPARPALYLTTTSEPLDKVVRFGQELEFFDASKVGTAVVYESLAPVLAADGLRGVSDRIHELVRDARPSMLVIDSFKALAPYASSPLVYREFVSELANRLSPLAISVFWVGEYAPDEVLGLTEGAVADAIIGLRSTASGQRTARYLQVLKLRGGDFLPGEHAYRLSAAGLSAFPRLADPVDPAPTEVVSERLLTGIPGLDEMLAGGVYRGSTTLVVGPSGSGKTVLALEFLEAGAARGSRGVFASLQENASQLARVLDPDRHARLTGFVTLHRRSPVDVYIDEWVYDVLTAVEETGAELLVIDSLSDLRIASPDVKRFEEYAYSLTQRLAQLGTTTVMTLESPPSLGFADMPPSTISHLSDNIILVGYQLSGSTVERGIHVLKSRASAHDQQVRQMTIGAGGIEIGEPLEVPEPRPRSVGVGAGDR
ncbi:MAG: RAD55 family ATPase [Chloroflexota bacterium]